MAKNNKRFENDEKKSIFIALIISAIVIIAIALTFVALIKHKKKPQESVVSAAENSVAEETAGQEIIVTTQEELDAALANNRLSITFQTDLEQTVTIAEGNYPDTVLIVDSPYTTIVNNASFGNIIINQIAVNTWEENATGNMFYINSPTTHFVVNEGASVASIENVQYYSTLAMEVYGNVDTIMCNAANSITSIMIDGTVGEITVYTKTNLSLSGKTAQFTNVSFESGSGDTVFSSSVKTIEYVYAGVESEFAEGAENSQVYIHTATARNVISNNTQEEISIIPSSGDTVSLEAGGEHIIEAQEQSETQSESSEEKAPVVSSNNGTRNNTGNDVSASTKGNVGSSSGTSTTSSNKDLSGNNQSTSATDKSVIDYIKSLFTKVENLENNIKKLTTDNEELKDEIETITSSIKIVGYPITRVVVDDVSEYQALLPEKLYANLENGGIETVDISWGVPEAVTDSCYKSTGTVTSSLLISTEAKNPVAYLYLIGEGYEFATENRNEYTVVEEKKPDISGNNSEEETEEETEKTVIIEKKPQKLYIIVNSIYPEIKVGNVKVSDLYMDRFLFPLTNESTEKDYTVKLYFYYFDNDKKLISSLGNNRFLEHSGEAVTLHKIETEDDSEEDEEVVKEEKEEGEEGNASEPIVVLPKDDESEEIPVESVIGAYWDPGKLEYKYLVVEVEIIE